MKLILVEMSIYLYVQYYIWSVVGSIIKYEFTYDFRNLINILFIMNCLEY